MTKTAERPDWRPRRKKRTGERSADVPPPAGEYLTLAQVAKELSVSERQVLRWTREQGLDFIRLPQGRRIARKQLEAWLDERASRR